mgnify:CR=1 FL=1
MYLLGIDVGSSSVKASLLNAENGGIAGTDFFPKHEMEINAAKAGWAEQDPELWWKYTKMAVKSSLEKAGISPDEIKAIGISYQMHGLVMVDKQHKALRPSIIWCDSRAVEIGNKAFQEIGAQRCLSQLLNSPGNFTASKLKWVKDNEPHLYEKIYKIMLPGDYIALKMSGELTTTASGLSEGIMWDFTTGTPADMVLRHYGFEKDFIPRLTETFSNQGELAGAAAAELGLSVGTPIGYRAGDQPNNAFSLNVLNPGELAATAGTSGVVYGISDEIKFDPESRVNTFLHVNNTSQAQRLGVLLCINGTGILNSWIRKNLAYSDISYDEINELAANVPIGSKGMSVLPFGNGAERVLLNKETGCHFSNLNFNIHSTADIYRAAQEGIVFAFHYGMSIMKNTGIDTKVIRAGKANMFLSPVFRETLAGITGATLELYDTDGSHGAARGAGVGAGIYSTFEEAFRSLKKLEEVSPDTSKAQEYEQAYQNWLKTLQTII